MDHLSDWHEFDSSDRKTYPKVDAPVQVRFDDETLQQGDTCGDTLRGVMQPTLAFWTIRLGCRPFNLASRAEMVSISSKVAGERLLDLY
jgi:hypothetical protein